MKTLSLILILFSATYSFAQSDTAAARLNNYCDRVFQAVNKCSMQDELITKAMKAKNAGQVESNRIELLQCTTDGIKILDSMENFNGDASLKFSGRETLKFYKRLAEFDMPQVKEFFMQEEKFLAAKKEFKSKPAKKISESEIYEYNIEIKKYNESVTRYTQLITFITANRKLTLYNWNASLKIFMETHRARK